MKRFHLNFYHAFPILLFSYYIKISSKSIGNITIIESDIAPKSELPINRNTIPDKVDSTNPDNIANSTNETISSNDGFIAENKPFTSYTPVKSVYVPKIQLPKANAITTAKMMPLIAYKGNIL